MHRQNPQGTICCSTRNEASTRYRSVNSKESSGNSRVLREDRHDIDRLFET